MNKDSVLQSIELAEQEVRKYIQRYKLPSDHTLVRDFLKVLELLKEDFSTTGIIRERVLRGFKDICTSTAIQFEESSFNNAIFEVNNKLEEYVPNYKHLTLLRMEFGKGNPI